MLIFVDSNIFLWYSRMLKLDDTSLF